LADEYTRWNAIQKKILFLAFLEVMGVSIWLFLKINEN